MTKQEFATLVVAMQAMYGRSLFILFSHRGRSEIEWNYFG